jgi:hypothetical protein
MYQKIGKKVAGSAGNVIWEITCNMKKSQGCLRILILMNWTD